MTRQEKLESATLKRHSDLFKAFEWLRREALDGSDHAAAIMREIRRMNVGRKSILDRPSWGPRKKWGRSRDAEW